MEHLQVMDIRLMGRPGSNYGDCAREAIAIAASEWRNVVFCAEGAWYKIQVNDLIAQVTRHPVEKESD